jgi:hypothetical protein
MKLNRLWFVALVLAASCSSDSSETDSDGDDVPDMDDPFPNMAGCPEGYIDTEGDGSACPDIDECAEGLDDCHADAACTNAEGSYSCTCNEGFTGDGTTCSDDDVSDPVISPAAMSFFVSSTSPSPNADGNLGGLAGADAHCTALAAAVNAEHKQWVAYLSTEGDPNTTADDVNAIDRIGPGPWYNADEVMFALNLDVIHTIETSIIACSPGPPGCLQDRADYILIKPADALFLDETGVQITDPLQGGGRGHDIFTGSNPDGTVFAGGTCNDWTSSATSTFARVGHTDAPTNTQFSPSWNSAHDTVDCSTSGVADRGGAGFVFCFATD